MRAFFYPVLFLLTIVQLTAKPPREIPKKLYRQYTLNNKIPVSYKYRDDSYRSDQPLIYTVEQIEDYIKSAANKERPYYRQTNDYLYSALEKYHHVIKGKEVAIIGSAKPWFESMIIFYGGHPTTIEYNRIISEDPRLTIMTVDDYKVKPKKFDAVLSISSFEHDGLGRYGDPINPNGDLEAMKNTKKMLKKGGLLFLAVPVGPDHLWWNIHRVYGPIRLPMLLKGWEKYDSFGYKKQDHKNQNRRGGYHQPVFVLKAQ